METIWPKNHIDLYEQYKIICKIFLAAALVHSILGNLKHHITAWNRNQKIPNPN